MKVICINLKGNKYITIGRSYDVLNISTKSIAHISYLITNNIGEREYYDSDCFKELSVIRNEKLESIGI